MSVFITTVVITTTVVSQTVSQNAASHVTAAVTAARMAANAPLARSAVISASVAPPLPAHAEPKVASALTANAPTIRLVAPPANVQNISRRQDAALVRAASNPSRFG